MQKTFKKGGPRVLISKNKKVSIMQADKYDRVTHFYFGNPDYIEAEKSWLDKFLWYEYCQYMQDQVKEYIYKNI
jgi:hypothetical protein